MHFLDTSEIKEYEHELVNEMALALSDARSRDEWRKEYMSIEMLKNEGRPEGREILFRSAILECTPMKSPKTGHFRE